MLEQVHINLLRYLGDEHTERKTPGVFDPDEWEMITHQASPRQLNCSDCGVFSCLFCCYLATETAFDFTQEDIPLIRYQPPSRFL